MSSGRTQVKEEYVGGGGAFCPRCRAPTAEAMRPEPPSACEDGGFVLDWQCLECGHWFRDVFTLTDVIELRKE